NGERGPGVVTTNHSHSHVPREQTPGNPSSDPDQKHLGDQYGRPIWGPLMQGRCGRPTLCDPVLWVLLKMESAGPCNPSHLRGRKTSNATMQGSNRHPSARFDQGIRVQLTSRRGNHHCRSFILMGMTSRDLNAPTQA